MPKINTPNITIIGASAGSGKTYTLCEKYFLCLTDTSNNQASIEPRQILATTFTRKAAAELVQRLREKLLTQGKHNAALSIEDGYIGTVHSVCLSLLKDFAFENGFPPDISPLPEKDEERIFTQATAAVMEKHGRNLHELSYRLNMDAFLPYKSSSHGLEKWDTTVRNLCKLARSNNLSPNDLRKQGIDNANNYLTILPQKMSEAETTKFYKELISAIKDALNCINNNGDGTQDTKKIKKNLLGWESPKDHPWQDWYELAFAKTGAKSCECIMAVQELASLYPKMPSFQQDITSYISSLFNCAADAMEAYAAWKKSYGLIDYNDMEALALKLLQESDTIQALQGRILQVFVDEFQDTNPLQLALFLQLASVAKSSVWVGDIKQAIYGFRYTDPSLMQAAVNCLGHNPKNDLKESWRSRECLVNFTNAYFKTAFGKYGIPETSVTLSIPKEHKETVKFPTGLRYWLYENKAKEEELASRVRYVLRHANDPEYQILDQEWKEHRPITAGDIAILCRKNSDCIKVADVLHQVGIPVDVSLLGLMEQPEIKLCLAAYRFCVDENDTIAILEMLRLLHPNMEEWLGTIFENGDEQSCKTSLLQEFAKYDCSSALCNLRPTLVKLSPFEAVQNVVSCIDGIRTIASWGNHTQRLANLDMLYAMAHQYEETCLVRHESCTHAGCIRWLMDAKEVPQAHNMDSNAVHVLTYHASKGLEWPMVILHSLSRKLNEHSAFGLQMLPPDGTFDIKKPLAKRIIHYWPWPTGTKQSLVASMDALVSKHQDTKIFSQQNRHEELRLLYVGMTRAKDILAFYINAKDLSENDTEIKRKNAKTKASTPEEDNGKCILKNLYPDVLVFPTKDTPAFILNNSQYPVLWEDCTDDDDDEPITTNEIEPTFPVPPKDNKPTFPLRVVTPNGLQQKPELAKAYTVLDLDGKISWGNGKDDPMKIGNIIHAWLCVDMPALLRNDDREKRCSFFAQTWGINNVDAQQLCAMSERLHKGILSYTEKISYGALLGYRVEWPIYQSNNNQILSGRMDLLAVCEKGLILVDHKFENATATKKLYNETAKRYSGQIDAYLGALRQTGNNNVQACLHLPAQGILLCYAIK